MKYIVAAYIKEWNEDGTRVVYNGENEEIVKSIVAGYASAGKFVTIEERA